MRQLFYATAPTRTAAKGSAAPAVAAVQEAALLERERSWRAAVDAGGMLGDADASG